MSKASTFTLILYEWERRQGEANCLASEAATQDKAWTWNARASSLLLPHPVHQQCPSRDKSSYSLEAQGTQHEERHRNRSVGMLAIHPAEAMTLRFSFLDQNAADNESETARSTWNRGDKRV